MAASASNESSRPWYQINETDLLCKTGCGFYGNPHWEGYCSKCWREYQQAHVGDKDKAAAVTPASKKQELGFDKFQEKKRHQTERKSSTFRSILKRTPGKDAEPYEDAEGEAKAHTAEFRRAFAHLRERLPLLTTEQMADKVQDVYTKLHWRLAKIDATKADDAILAFENWMTTQMYVELFSPPDDEAMDLKLQSSIRQLHWVVPGGFLNCQIKADMSIVAPHLHEAIASIIQLTSHKGVADKLICIHQCCTKLLEALRDSMGRPPSADDFLPALIYLLLTSNPPLLQSNISFITRYANPSRLLTGEQAYYFTNLCCAVHFLQNLTPASLGLTQEEYDAYCSGKLIPRPSTLSPTMRRFADIEDRIREMREKCTDLEQQRIEHDQMIEKRCIAALAKCKEIREKYPIPPELPIEFDSPFGVENASQLAPHHGTTSLQ